MAENLQHNVDLRGHTEEKFDLNKLQDISKDIVEGAVLAIARSKESLAWIEKTELDKFCKRLSYEVIHQNDGEYLLGSEYFGYNPLDVPLPSSQVAGTEEELEVTRGNTYHDRHLPSKAKRRDTLGSYDRTLVIKLSIQSCYKIKAEYEQTKVAGIAVGGSLGVAGGTAGGAAIGASIGSVVPGPGTLIGGVVGGIIGAVSGGTTGGVTGAGVDSLRKKPIGTFLFNARDVFITQSNFEEKDNQCSCTIKVNYTAKSEEHVFAKLDEKFVDRDILGGRSTKRAIKKK